MGSADQDKAFNFEFWLSAISYNFHKWYDHMPAAREGLHTEDWQQVTCEATKVASIGAEAIAETEIYWEYT